MSYSGYRPSQSLTQSVINSLVLVLLGLIFLWPTQAAVPPDNPVRVDLQLFQSPSLAPLPTRVTIPRLDIDLPVTASPVTNGLWEVSPITASYGLGSGLPGQQDNIVVFAHARPGLFFPLRLVKIGDDVSLYTSQGRYIYKVIRIQTVSPQDIQVIAPTSTETLTLYTCSGYQDARRLVVTAQPVPFPSETAP